MLRSAFGGNGVKEDPLGKSGIDSWAIRASFLLHVFRGVDICGSAKYKIFKSISKWTLTAQWKSFPYGDFEEFVVFFSSV